MPFDAEAFLNSASVDAPLSTVTIPIDEGNYKAMIKEIKINEPQMINKGPRAGQMGSPVLDVTWALLDDALKAKLERDEVLVHQTVWLDIDQTGNLDTGKGKNVDLGRLREALGVNDRPGNAFQNLTGGLALLKIGQVADADNPEQKYARVKRVAALP